MIVFVSKRQKRDAALRRRMKWFVNSGLWRLVAESAVQLFYERT